MNEPLVLTIKESIRRAASLGPRWLEDWLRQGWQRRHCRRFMKEQGIPRITAAWVQRHGLKVLEGPFAGLNFVNESAGSMLVPKLVGSYESELHSIIDDLLQCSSEITKIVDVGCAEGYYAVGFAHRLPNVVVHAYDVDPKARRLCRRMAQLNAVSARVKVHGRCDPIALEAVGLNGALVICDCEGFEYRLLDPQLAPSLRGARLLVELHGSNAETEALLERFSGSHEAQVIPVSARNPKEFPDWDFLAEQHRTLAVCEFRNQEQQWVYLHPRARSSPLP